MPAASASATRPRARAIALPRTAGADLLPLGFVSTFLAVVVVLPIAALVWESKRQGAASFWRVVSGPEAVAALELTLGAAVVVSLLNAVLGSVTAWVLVRDGFRGKALVNAVVDLPFALPTIVAGLTLIALYGPRSPVGIDVAFTRAAIVLALCFVTLPFVVRAVQPVLLELDGEAEQAARSLGASQAAVFRRIVFPHLVPGILSGVSLALARAVGEIGAVVLVSGNLPYRTEVSSVLVLNRIESGDAAGAAAVAVVLLCVSLALLLAIGGLRSLVTRHERV